MSKKKIDYRNAEECRYLSYKDMNGMTLEDAIYIVSKPVSEYHKAKNDREREWLPRARLIRAFELLLEAAEKEMEKINHE